MTVSGEQFKIIHERMHEAMRSLVEDPALSALSASDFATVWVSQAAYLLNTIGVCARSHMIAVLATGDNMDVIARAAVAEQNE